MKPEQQEIINIISEYLEKNPDIRFSQALFNLDINQFATADPSKSDFKLRDIYNDSDTFILKRIKNNLNK